MAGLLVDVVQPATAVGSAVSGRFLLAASSAHEQHVQLLVATGDVLQLWVPSEEQATLQPQHTYQLSEAVEHLALVPDGLHLFGTGTGSNPAAVLVFTADLRVALLRFSPDWEPHRAMRPLLTEAAGAALQLPPSCDGDEPFQPKRVTTVCCSNVAVVEGPHGRQPRGCLLASVFTGLLHIVTISCGDNSSSSSSSASRGNAPTLRVDVVDLCDTPLSSLPQGCEPLYRVQQAAHVMAMQWLPPRSDDPTAKPLLAALHASEGAVGGAGGGGGLRLDCVEVDLDGAALRKGPWAARNLHPTTTLLAPFHGSRRAPLPGVLAISSRGVALYCQPPSLASAATSGAAARQQQRAAAAASSSSRAAGPQSDGTAALEGLAIAAAESGTVVVELAQFGMQGLPACCEELAPGVLAVADSAAGLYLVGVAGPSPWCRRVDVMSGAGLEGAAPPLAVASALRYVPLTADQQLQLQHQDHQQQQQQQVAEGLLFVGSAVTNSQVLAVPGGTLQQAATQQPMAAPRWPLAEAAALKSLAPVQDAVVVPGSGSGSDDPWVVASCGVAPAGRLARMRMAFGLRPYMADGPEVPGGVRMFALRLGDSTVLEGADAQPELAHTTHIAFSFEAAGRTDVLRVSGGVFTHVSLDGLDATACSLHVGDVGGRWLVQVTATGVRVVEQQQELQEAEAGSRCGPVAAATTTTWRPTPAAAAATGAGGLVLAAQHGSVLAVAARAQLHLLWVDPTTGAVSQLATCTTLEAQLSALALAELPAAAAPPGAAGAAPGVALLTGEWVTNRVVVWRCGRGGGAGKLEQLLQLQLGGETPRSLALLPLQPAPGPGPGLALLAGSNTGKLLMWQLQLQPGQGQGQAGSPGGEWRAGACLGVNLGHTAVELRHVPASAEHGPYVYVHCADGAVVRPRPVARPTPGSGTAAAPLPPRPLSLAERLEVVRVQGASALGAICHISTAAMPSSVAWVSGAGRLLFGRLELSRQLRWTTAFVGDTVHHLAYHAASRCLVALCETEAGDNCLRLVHSGSLQQVAAMRLAPGHYYTALLVAELPCSSSSAPSSSAQPLSSGRGTQQQQHQHQHRQQQQELSSAAGSGGGRRKEFVVLASYLLLEPGADPRVAHVPGGGHRQQGMLTFLEVAVDVGAAVGGGGGMHGATEPSGATTTATHYALLMHGACAISSVATSLAVVRPPLRPAAAVAGGPSSPAKAAAAGPAAAAGEAIPPTEATGAAPEGARPVLVVGCHDGCRLYSVHIDDARSDGDVAVSRALQLVGRLDDDLRLPVPDGGGGHALPGPGPGLAAAAATAVNNETRAGVAPLAAAGGLRLGEDEDEDEQGLLADESELPDVPPDVAALGRAGATAMDMDSPSASGSSSGDEGGSEEDEGQEAEEERRGRGGAGGVSGRSRGREVQQLLAWLTSPRHRPRAGLQPGSDSGSDDGGYAGGEDGGRASGWRPSVRQLLQDAQRDWGQHVLLQQVAHTPTFGGGCVSSLGVCGGGSGGGGGATAMVVASDFMGSLTLLQAVATPKGASLLPTSADRHPIFAQCAVALSPTQVLAAVHPHGLALLRRDVAAEQQAITAVQQAAMQNWEAGQQQQRGDPAGMWDNAGVAGGRPAAAARGDAAMRAAGGPPHAQTELQELPSLDVVAACRVRHGIFKMVAVQLGLAPHAMDEDGAVGVPHEAASASPMSTEEGGAGSGQQWQHQPDTVLCFASSGMVAAVSLLRGGRGPASEGTPEALLARLQQALRGLPPASLALLGAVPLGGAAAQQAAKASWALHIPKQTAAGANLGSGAGGPDMQDVDMEAEQPDGASCVDGAMLRLLLTDDASAEPVLQCVAQQLGYGSLAELRVACSLLLQ